MKLLRLELSVLLLGTAVSTWAGPLPPLQPLPEPPVPAYNPLTPAKARLGRRLFFDTRLSRTGTMSCATCHVPEKAFTDGKPRAANPRGKELGRHTMTVLNAAYASSFFWDGRAATLEAQALHPFLNPDEMDLMIPELVSRVLSDGEYLRLFHEAYPGESVSTRTIVSAMAAYERTLVSRDSPYERWLRGNRSALGAQARRGVAVFAGKGRCVLCHNGPALTDGRFRNIGVAPAGPWLRDPGRQRIDMQESSRRSFKTPSLLEVPRTPPYMHDGIFSSLRQVVDFYDRGGDVPQGLDPDMRPLGLTTEEKKDLLAFLEALTDASSAQGEANGAR